MIIIIIFHGNIIINIVGASFEKVLRFENGSSNTINIYDIHLMTSSSDEWFHIVDKDASFANIFSNAIEDETKVKLDQRIDSSKVGSGKI